MKSKITTISERNDKILSVIANSLLLVLLFAPELAQAQTTSTTSTALSGITVTLKGVAQAVIFDWGYYIGIISLGIQGYRWKMGRIDTMHLVQWGLGISLVFFAPNIVTDLKSRSQGSIQ